MEYSDKTAQHLGAMGIIFIISLFAVSFPALSQRIRFLSIPKILFFVGKHFGTGVILSTAFCHLLQDSFEALTSQTVKDNYPGVGSQTGFIILGSLLTIFVIEYVSTSYVDHLHEEPSNESSESPGHGTQSVTTSNKGRATDENTPLLSSSFLSRRSRDSVSSHIRAPSHIRNPSISKAHYLDSIVTNSPRHSRSGESFYFINDLNYHLNHGECHIIGRSGPCVCVCVCPAGSEGPGGRQRLVMARGAEAGTSAALNDDDDTELELPVLSRKRQVVGLLVLQLGIMIHSFVIGLTLSITSGAEFTTLVTAIVFHQLFEGLSLGIRIATIPPADNDKSSGEPSSPNGSHRSILQPVLTILFAVTTPIGIALGMLLFSPGKSSESRMQLIQGLMSAISAGLLIYAATVEMLAGDFVFGNLGGYGTGIGGHGHGHGGEAFTGTAGDGHHEEEEEEGVSLKKRTLAVGSLLAGVAAMGLVGLGD